MAAKQDGISKDLELVLFNNDNPISEDAAAIIAKALKEDLHRLAQRLKESKELRCVCIKKVQNTRERIFLSFALTSEKQVDLLYECLKTKENKLTKKMLKHIKKHSIGTAAGLKGQLSCNISMKKKEYHLLQAAMCSDDDSLTGDLSGMNSSNVEESENAHDKYLVDQVNESKEKPSESFSQLPSETSDDKTASDSSFKPTVRRTFVAFLPPPRSSEFEDVFIDSAFNMSSKGSMSRRSNIENMYEFRTDIPTDKLKHPFKYVCKYKEVCNKSVFPMYAECEISSDDIFLKDCEVQRHCWHHSALHPRDVHKFHEEWMYAHLCDIFNSRGATRPDEWCIQIETVVNTLDPLPNASSLINRLADYCRKCSEECSVLFILVLGNLCSTQSIEKGFIKPKIAKKIISFLENSNVTVDDLSMTSKESVYSACKALYEVCSFDTSDINILDAFFNFFGTDYKLSLLRDENAFKPYDNIENYKKALFSIVDKLFKDGSSVAQTVLDSIVRRLPFDIAIDCYVKMSTPESNCSMHSHLYGSMTVVVEKHMANIKKSPETAFSKFQEIVVVLSKHDELFQKFSDKIASYVISIIEKSLPGQCVGDHKVCILLMTECKLFNSLDSKEKLLNCLISSQNIHLLDVFKDLSGQLNEPNLLAWLSDDKFKSFCENYIVANTHCGKNPSILTYIEVLCGIGELPIVKQNGHLRHVVCKLTLNWVQKDTFKSLFENIEKIDRLSSKASHVEDAIVSHITEQLSNDHETAASLLTMISPERNAPQLKTRLSTVIVNAILNVSGSLPEDVSYIERLNHLVANFEFWNLIFISERDFQSNVCENSKFVAAKACIIETFNLLKKHDICYNFLKTLDESKAEKVLRLIMYWIKPNEVLKIWDKLKCEFNKLVETCDTAKSIINAVTKNEPRVAKEFTEFSERLKKFVIELETGELTLSCFRKCSFWQEMEIFVAPCNKCYICHVQSTVYWNTCRQVVFEEMKQPFTKDICEVYVVKFFEIGSVLYRDIWLELAGTDVFTIQKIIDMFGSNPNIEKEIQYARTSLKVNIDEDLAKTLTRMFSINTIAKTVTNVRGLFGMFGIDFNRDEIFHEDFTVFNQLLEGTDKKKTLIEVKQHLENVFKLVSSLENANDILDAIVKATTLIEFLKDIVDENIQNLIDAVEDISEHQVQASTVAALIDVKQFLQPMLVFKDDWTCTDILDLINKQTVLYVEKAGLLPSKIDDCVQNVHNLRSLYNGLANKSEQTKEIVRKILLSGVYKFCLSANYNSVQFQVALPTDNEVRKQSTLIDLRSRALLLMNTFKKEKSEKHADGVKLENFVRDVDICLEIIELLFNLHTAGHTDFREIDQSIKTECLEEKKNSLIESLVNWQTILNDVRHKYYLMNFISGNQLHSLDMFFKGSVNCEQSVQTILSFIHPGLKAHRVKQEYAKKIAGMKIVDDKNMLLCIGDAIHCAYAGLTVCPQPININRNRISDIVLQGKLVVVQLEERSLETVKTLLSLFINTTQCLPESSQVLFCRHDTAWTDIDLLVKRCEGAGEFYQIKKLFCIANVESLPGELQFRLVEKLHQLERGSSKFLLAVICRGSRNHPFVDELRDCLSAVKPATDRTVGELFSTHFPEVYTLTSTRAGQGKSTYVRSLAHGQQKGLTKLHISGQVGKFVLVDRLKSLEMKEHQILHIDIGGVEDPSEIDTFLFELIVLKYVSTGREAVTLVSKYVFIEIANSIEDKLTNSLHTTLLFKRKKIRFCALDEFVVSKEVHSSVQIVCSYLNYLDKGKLDESDLKLKKTNWKPLSEQRCRNLLSKFVFKKNDEIFTVMHATINVLADQLKKMSSSSFFKVSRLHEMVGNKTPLTIRSKLVRAMIEVATDFATRSVESCRENQTAATITRNMEKKPPVKADNSTKIVNVIDGMIRWEDSNHLMFVFHNQNINTLSALYRHLSKVPNDIKQMFESQMKKKMVDFSVLKQDDFQVLLQKIARGNPMPLKEEPLLYISLKYSLTADNLLKMVLIMLRVKANIPVVIMGETGCGKTSLIRYLASVCEVHFEVFNIHAGIPEDVIAETLLRNNEMALENTEEERWLFLDEINTSKCIGLITDAICHHFCLGCELAPNLVVMGACNPYKLRTSEDIITAGIESKIKTDKLSRLVYRVYPLPEIMINYIWDFGSLNENDEKMYIHKMIQDVFPYDSKSHIIFTDLLSLSQKFVRDHDKSQYSVSLRDIQRCRILAKWFMKILPMKHNTNKGIEIKSMILSLSLNYHARFSKKKVREEYRKTIGALCASGENKINDDQGNFIHKMIKEEQADILRRMKLPTGIARNTALQENVFALLVCIFNRIPIFVVGKPGCSKSLAMQLIRSNLRGKDSEDMFFKMLPQLHCVSFQGSESSTSDGIIKVFEKAEFYQDANKNGDVLSVVVLDEIGLAEISRFNPLKVLHSLLEPGGQSQPNIAVVGISNWALDASKMNRAIYLYRPDMDEEELLDTSYSISDSFLGSESERISSSPEHDLHKVLRPIATAYFKYIQQLDFKNFHGLRDYYALVKYVAKYVAKEYADADDVPVIRLDNIIVHGVARNFGGLPEGIETLYNVLRENFSSYDPQQSHLLDLVIENITDPIARHLMLITTGESVLEILDQKLKKLDSRQRVIIFGSKFEEDLTDDYNYRILSRIILCMEQGMILVLKDLDYIYGSLYDMLNQNYTTIGKKKNCRVALGPYSNPICQVADNFRCIVLVDENKLRLSDPPFLNRFEKQYLRFSDIIQEKHTLFIEALTKWIGKLTEEKDKMNVLFPICNKDLLASIVLKIDVYAQESEQEINIIDQCQMHLLQIMKPNAIVRLQKISSADSDIARLVNQYFELPLHDGLEKLMIHQQNNSPKNVLKYGILSVVFTNSNIHSKIQIQCDETQQRMRIEKLSAYKSEKQLSTRIQMFWDDRNVDHLVIQCNAKDEGCHILLTKLVVERCRKDNVHKANEKPKHVYLIIHIDHQNETSHEGLSQLNFLSDWTMYMLDCINCPRTSLPKLCEMSIEEVIKNRRPLITLKEELVWAFSRIRYEQFGRSKDSVFGAISKIKESNTLMEILENEIIYLIECQQHSKYWVASYEDLLKESSSGFIDALERHIQDSIKLPFAKLIFQIESMSLLESFFVVDSKRQRKDVIAEKRRAWVYCLRNKCTLFLRDIRNESGPECYTCRSHDLQLKMPCSQAIYDATESIKDEFLDLVATYRLHCLLHKNEELPLEVFNIVLSQHEKVIKDKLPYLNMLTYTKWRLEYMDDFCSMTLDALLIGESNLLCLPFLFQILCRHDINFKGDSFVFILRLHAIVWAQFDSVRSELLFINKVLSKMPECESELLAVMSDYVVINNAGMKDSEYFEAITKKIKVEDVTNVSCNSKYKTKEAYFSMSVKERLVHFVCKLLLPSNQCVERHKGIANWSLTVNEVLPFAAKLSKKPHILYSLKVSSEIAENLISYYNLNDELLTNIGRSLLNHSLDSIEVYEALIRIIDSIADKETEFDEQAKVLCYQTLSSYLVRCLAANSDTIIFCNFFEYVMKNRISCHYFRFFKVPLKRFLRTINVHMFAKVLSNESFLDKSSFEDALSESNKTEKHLLQNVDRISKFFLKNKTLETPVLALLVDILEEIFNDNIFPNVLAGDYSRSKSGKKCDGTKLTNTFYQCVKTLTSHEPGLKYISSIAFSKCFTYYSTHVMENGNENQVANMMNVLNCVHNNLLKDGFYGLTCFQVKLMLQRRTVMQTQKYYVSKARNLTFYNVEMFDFGTRNLHNSALCTHVDINEHKKLCFCCQEITDEDKLKDLIKASTETVSGMTQMFAFVVRDFFLSKNTSDHDDSKTEVAVLLVNEVKASGHKHGVPSFVKCLTGHENFHISDFEIDKTSSHREICILSFTVTFMALLLANDRYTFCQHKRRSYLTRALLEPESLRELPLPGFCLLDRPNEVSDTLYVGICDCRNKVYSHASVEKVKCKLCGHNIILAKYEQPIAFECFGVNNGKLADKKTSLSECILQFLVQSSLLGSIAIGYASIESIHKSFNFKWTETSEILLKKVFEDWDTIGLFVNTNHNDTAILMNALLLEANDILFRTCDSCLKSENKIKFEERFATVVEGVFGEKTRTIQRLYSNDNKLHQHHDRKGGFNDQVFELTGLSTISTHDSLTKLPQLYRLNATATQENFFFELTRQQHQFPLLGTVVQYQNILSLPTHIMNILLWHSTTVVYASYMMKKQKCMEMKVIEFIDFKNDTVSRDVAKKRFENFKTSWEFVRKALKDTDKEEYKPIHDETLMAQCLILDEKSMIFKALKTLINIQNCFLDNVGRIANATMTLQSLIKDKMAYIPCVPLLELKKDDLLDTQLDMDIILQEESQSDLRYGHGTKVHYDFYRIEEHVAKQVVFGKKYITSLNKLPKIIFIDEIHLNYSSLLKEIKDKVEQDSLSEEMCKCIKEKKNEDRRMPSKLLTHVGIVMTIVKKSETNATQTLVDFVDTLDPLICQTFPKALLPTPQSNIQLRHIVALSELLEELCADNIKDSLSPVYRDPLDKRFCEHFKMLLKDEELSLLLLGALKRFMYRCLASTTADSRLSLRQYISDESFWPEKNFEKDRIKTSSGEYRTEDILPDGLMVRHVFDIVNVIEKENKERTIHITEIKDFASRFNQNRGDVSESRSEEKMYIAIDSRQF